MKNNTEKFKEISKEIEKITKRSSFMLMNWKCLFDIDDYECLDSLDMDVKELEEIMVVSSFIYLKFDDITEEQYNEIKLMIVKNIYEVKKIIKEVNRLIAIRG